MVSAACRNILLTEGSEDNKRRSFGRSEFCFTFYRLLRILVAFRSIFFPAFSVSQAQSRFIAFISFPRNALENLTKYISEWHRNDFSETG
jgi:hypothetical protein